MDFNKSSSQQRLKWRCQEHPKNTCDFICLNGDDENRVTCFHCVQKYQIPVTNLLSMSCVLDAAEDDIIEAYPPLKDQLLFEKLREAGKPQQLEQIVVYFNKLREDIEKEIQAAEKRAKEALKKQLIINEDLLEGYIRIAEVEKLKKLIVSEKESAEKDLDDFIKEKWRKADQNRQVITDLMNQYETVQFFTTYQPNLMAQKMIENIRNIDFFEQSILSKVNLINKPRNNQFQVSNQINNDNNNMVITKVDNQFYQIKYESQHQQKDSVFLDPIINPFQKYILVIELEHNPRTSSKSFQFGLMKDEVSDYGYYESQMCYCDSQNSYGITKYIKGNQMQSRGLAAKRSFEVRIHLNQQFLRVASLPDYSSVVELDDPKKIDPKVPYRFFLSMQYQGEIMRIMNIRAVDRFDTKM